MDNELLVLLHHVPHIFGGLFYFSISSKSKSDAGLRVVESLLDSAPPAAIIIVSIRIEAYRWDVAHIAVLVERLRVAESRIGNGNRRSRPVRRDEPPQAVGVVSGSEVIQASLTIAFFAGELVMVGIVVDELKLAAPGIIVRFRFDVAR